FDRVWEELRQPGPAGPDDDVGARLVGRRDAPVLEARTVALRVLDEELRPATRVQHAGIRLEQHTGQVARLERRVEAARLVRGEPLLRDAEGVERVAGLGLEPRGG